MTRPCSPANTTQPWQAYAQANVINEHATQIAGGKTYAELPQNDPNRNTVMNASFLQASLFTSVLAFGVAAMAAVIGLLLVVIGAALRPAADTSAAPPADATSAIRPWLDTQTKNPSGV